MGKLKEGSTIKLSIWLQRSRKYKGKSYYKRVVYIPSTFPFQDGTFSFYEENGKLYLELKPLSEGDNNHPDPSA